MSATMERGKKEYDKLDTALLIADFFAECAEQGIPSISTREILSMLGITNPDFEYENVVYELTNNFDKAKYKALVEDVYHSKEFVPEEVLTTPNNVSFF